MTISLPITALVASAMLLHPATAYSLLFGHNIIGDYNLFTPIIKHMSTSLEVGGRIAIGEFTDDSRNAKLIVGEQNNFDGQCPSPLAYCPLENILVEPNEIVFYSNQVPWNIYDEATVCNGVAFSNFDNVANTSYEGIPNWKFERTTNKTDATTCGPNKLFPVEIIEFETEMALAAQLSKNLIKYDGTKRQCHVNCEEECIDFHEGEFCHENKLLVIPELDLLPPDDDVIARIVRYNLTCAQFNEMQDYKIFDRNTENPTNVTLSFTFDGVQKTPDDKSICVVTTEGDFFKEHPDDEDFDDYNIVWNFIGDALLFTTQGNFYGTFIAADEDKDGIIGQTESELDQFTDGVVNLVGQVIAKRFQNLPASIKVTP